jgi:hypothetical protein
MGGPHIASRSSRCLQQSSNMFGLPVSVSNPLRNRRSHATGYTAQTANLILPNKSLLTLTMQKKQSHNEKKSKTNISMRNLFCERVTYLITRLS